MATLRARRTSIGVAVGLLAAAASVGIGGGPVEQIATPAAAQVAPGPGLLAVPDPLPAGAPGDVIAEAPFDPGPFPFTVEPHQILFHSTDRTGADTAVSGFVLVPTGVDAPAGGRAVVAWAHGTTGLIDGCAPSLDNQYQGRLNSPESYDRIDNILAAGHIVVASDYPGLGTPGVHPYLDGPGEGRSVLDSIRAAREFGGNDVAVIQGFSQGSQAAIFAGQLWSSYAPEIDLRAIVPIGTPSLFGDAFAAIDLPVVRGYINLVLAGIIAGHPELDRTDILTPSGEEAYDDLAALDAGPLGFCERPNFDLDNDLRVDPTTLPDWRAAFEANYPGMANVAVPVLMVQSRADEQALAFLAFGVCNDLQDNGTDLRMWLYDDEDHVDTVRVSADDRMTWILDRLAGEPPTDAVAFTGEAPEVLATCPDDGTAQPPPPPPSPTTPTDPTTPGGPTPKRPAATQPGSARPAIARPGQPSFTG